MILGYKVRTKKGRPTYFVQQILDGHKIHTLREDEYNRWKAGMSIQHSINIRTPNYSKFKDDVCTGVQKVLLTTDNVNISIYVDGKLLDGSEVVRFYRNDGFKSFDEFSEWFLPICQKVQALGLKGKELKLIHWTNLKY